MPLIDPTVTQVESIYGHVNSVVWGPFAAGDTFTPYQNAGSADRSIHVHGTFSSTVITVVGSNELVTPTSLVALTDPLGNAISISAADIVQVQEVTNWIAPVATGGTGSALFCRLICRRTL